MTWRDLAIETIRQVHAELPKEATLQQRKDALFAAYPFGQREFTPYKVWNQEKRKYLAQFGPPPGPLFNPQSPLDRAKAKSERRNA